MASVLITGCNRGIGLELSKCYLKAGWRVYACCRKPVVADALHKLKSSSAELSIHSLDVLDDKSIAALKNSLLNEPIDLLINNAGILGDQESNTFGNMNYENWLEVFQVNTMAPMKMLEALLDNLKAGRQKHVVTISSAMASISSQDGYMFAYGSSKTAMNSVMKSLSMVLKDEGIRVNMISPGWVKTNMGGQDAPLTPEKSADLLYHNIQNLGLADTGCFLDHEGNALPW